MKRNFVAHEILLSPLSPAEGDVTAVRPCMTVALPNFDRGGGLFQRRLLADCHPYRMDAPTFAHDLKDLSSTSFVQKISGDNQDSHWRYQLSLSLQ